MAKRAWGKKWEVYEGFLPSLPFDNRNKASSAGSNPAAISAES